MSGPKSILAAALAALAFAGAAHRVGAEEGMWTFDAFPAAEAEAALGVRLDQAWLDRARAGAVRLSGCSASLVSPNGLVLTNQHCVRACLQTFSTPERDVVAEGFSARTRAEERVCPGQTAEVLLRLEDVSARVRAAGEGRTGGEFARARAAEAAAVERETCGTDAKLRCQVVALHRGGRHVLHVFRRYTDVRMVFAPEGQSVIFGGDPDNFNFPRYSLDAAFLRVWEDGAPAHTPGRLRFSARAPRPEEPVFVVGNPGTTARLMTVAQLETERDARLPAQLKRRAELRGRIIRFTEESDDNRRLTRNLLRGTENALKGDWGRHQALADPAFMAAKRAQEAELRARVAADPALAAEIGDPWSEIEAVQASARALAPSYELLETQAGGASVLFDWARAVVRGGAERARAESERLGEYAAARLAVTEKRVLDPRPVETELEVMHLAFWLSKTREALGRDHPAVVRLLGRESPEALARRLVAGTRLHDTEVRAALWRGGAEAVAASDDPLIRFVAAADADARAARAAWRERVEGPTERAAERLARARFALYGERVYPDATFSPRISYGRIRGWTEDGRAVAPITTVGGLFERATGAPPYDVAPRWAERRARLDPNTPFTFVTTNDIVGGNSGSPLLDAKGEVIGVVFDGNLPSLGGTYGYDPTLNRAVVVSSAAVRHALERVYDRPDLIRELEGR